MSLSPMDISRARIAELDGSDGKGGAEAKNLAELLTIDFAKLARACVPELVGMEGFEKLAGGREASSTHGERLGIVTRMEIAGKLVAELSNKRQQSLSSHTSDTIRGWACYALVRFGKGTFQRRLAKVRNFADDGNSGVREWAWMALRPAVIAEIEHNSKQVIDELLPWTVDAQTNVRRFAIELTRPRGVWCSHIAVLRKNPQLGARLLEGVKDDASKYVQDSVANWLNDASKDDAEFVRTVTNRWLKQAHATDARKRICMRALRTLSKGQRKAQAKPGKGSRATTTTVTSAAKVKPRQGK